MGLLRCSACLGGPGPSCSSLRTPSGGLSKALRPCVWEGPGCRGAAMCRAELWGQELQGGVRGAGGTAARFTCLLPQGGPSLARGSHEIGGWSAESLAPLPGCGEGRPAGWGSLGLCLSNVCWPVQQLLFLKYVAQQPEPHRNCPSPAPPHFRGHPAGRLPRRGLLPLACKGLILQAQPGLPLGRICPLGGRRGSS